MSWYPAYDEGPTTSLRLNSCNARLPGRLQQLWLCRQDEERWAEWRDVPSVHEASFELDGSRRKFPDVQM